MTRFFFILAAIILIPVSTAAALGEIAIQEVNLEAVPPDHYYVLALVTNSTDQPREVTLRAQVLFYEKTAPVGDKPALSLRKDMELVLNPGETRALRVRMLHTGDLPSGELRTEARLRLRRQRLWKY